MEGHGGGHLRPGAVPAAIRPHPRPARPRPHLGHGVVVASLSVTGVVIWWRKRGPPAAAERRRGGAGEAPPLSAEEPPSGGAVPDDHEPAGATAPALTRARRGRHACDCECFSPQVGPEAPVRRRHLARRIAATSLLPFAAAWLGPAAAQLQPGGGSAPELNLYSSPHYDTDRELYDAFARETGVRVRLIEGDADQLIARIQSEGRNSPGDVLITVDAARLARAKQAGILRPSAARCWRAASRASLRDPEGHWFGVSKRARVVMYDKREGPAAGPRALRRPCRPALPRPGLRALGRPSLQHQPRRLRPRGERAGADGGVGARRGGQHGPPATGRRPRPDPRHPRRAVPDRNLQHILPGADGGVAAGRGPRAARAHRRAVPEPGRGRPRRARERLRRRGGGDRPEPRRRPCASSRT